MRSIRRTMLLGSAIGTLLVLGAAGVVIDLGARHVLLDELDRSLTDKARVLASTLALTTKGLEVDFADFDMTEFMTAQSPSHLVLWLAGDSLLYASARADRGDLAPFAGWAAGEHLRSLRPPGGQSLRAVQLNFRPRLDLEEDDELLAVPGPPPAGPGAQDVGAEDEENEDPDEDKEELADEAGPVDRGGAPALAAPPAPLIALIVARDTARIDAILVRLRGLLLAVGLLAALVVLLLLRGVVQRGFRPVDRLAREISALDAASLSARIRLTDAPLEIVPIVTCLNELMERLASAFQRERTFSADIAHELRTPLAGLRTSIEVELSRPREADRYRESLSEALVIVERMQELVQSLLLLGRLEAGQLQIEARRVDLAAQAREILTGLATPAAARGLRIEDRLPVSLPVLTDPTLLATVLRNILANAVAHADANGTIRVELEPAAVRPALRVSNSGSRVAQNEVSALWERFARGDAARSDTHLHSGLGLALVQRAATALGLDVTVVTEVGGDFTVILSALKSDVGPA